MFSASPRAAILCLCATILPSLVRGEVAVEDLCDLNTLDLKLDGWNGNAGFQLLSQQWRSSQCPGHKDETSGVPSTANKDCCNAWYDTAFFNNEIEERKEFRQKQQRARRGCCALCNPAFSPSSWSDQDSVCKSGLSCEKTKNGAYYCISTGKGRGTLRRIYNVATDIVPTIQRGVRNFFSWCFSKKK